MASSRTGKIVLNNARQHFSELLTQLQHCKCKQTHMNNKNTGWWCGIAVTRFI